MNRNRYIGRQLRDALRRCRWDAGTIARRAAVSREVMAKALVGHTDVSLGDYGAIADELRLTLTFTSWPEPEHRAMSAVETVVDVALRRIERVPLAHLERMFNLPVRETPLGIRYVLLSDVAPQLQDQCETYARKRRALLSLPDGRLAVFVEEWTDWWTSLAEDE